MWRDVGSEDLTTRRRGPSSGCDMSDTWGRVIAARTDDTAPTLDKQTLRGRRGQSRREEVGHQNE